MHQVPLLTEKYGPGRVNSTDSQDTKKVYAPDRVHKLLAEFYRPDWQQQLSLVFLVCLYVSQGYVAIGKWVCTVTSVSCEMLLADLVNSIKTTQWKKIKQTKYLYFDILEYIDCVVM